MDRRSARPAPLGRLGRHHTPGRAGRCRPAGPERERNEGHRPEPPLDGDGDGDDREQQQPLHQGAGKSTGFADRTEVVPGQDLGQRTDAHRAGGAGDDRPGHRGEPAEPCRDRQPGERGQRTEPESDGGGLVDAGQGTGHVEGVCRCGTDHAGDRGHSPAPHPHPGSVVASEQRRLLHHIDRVGQCRSVVADVSHREPDRTRHDDPGARRAGQVAGVRRGRVEPCRPPLGR